VYISLLSSHISGEIRYLMNITPDIPFPNIHNPFTNE